MSIILTIHCNLARYPRYEHYTVTTGLEESNENDVHVQTVHLYFSSIISHGATECDHMITCSAVI